MFDTAVIYDPLLTDRELFREWTLSRRIFPWAPTEPVTCIAMSDSMNWCFFGAEVQDFPCEGIGECYYCWPACGYCWFDCDFHDGVCNDEDCLTHETWAWRIDLSKLTGPPWFTRPYVELKEGRNASPVRPPRLRRWRIPLVPTTEDNALHYPQAAERFHTTSIAVVWRHLWGFCVLPPRPGVAQTGLDGSAGGERATA